MPPGALAVLMNLFFTPSVAGTFASITPQGTAWNNANYPIVGTAFNATNIAGGSFVAQLNSSNGQIDVKAQVGNCVGMHAYFYAYIM